ncbi:hypothetical protein AB0N09_08985 [Streptomyces erythrochromogenes]|uniref:DUF6924 domain-containing protein n=1 Tax=Streptomyces erythrochromogenes TaxID=285574 RepID=UPI0034388397
MLPEVAGRDEFSALVIRTDYDDEPAWRAVVAALHEQGVDGEFEASVHVVDDPVWAGATPDAVVAAVGRDEDLSVVFIADGATMRSPHRALLALDLGAEEEDLDPEYYRELVDSPPPREFRTVPAGVHDVHANLSIANMDFEEYAHEALADPEGVYRSL